MADRRYALIGHTHSGFDNDIDLLAGANLTIFDSTNSDSAVFSHDGTNFSTDFTNTADWEIDNLDRLIIRDAGQADFIINTGLRVDIRNGLGLRIRDADDTDYVNLAHDGTNLNITSVGTTWIDFESTGIRLLGGSDLEIRDAASTDVANFSHNGTDFITSFVNTTDYNITGHSGTIRVPAGSGIGSSAVTASGFSIHNLSLADDATGTVSVGTHALVMVVSNYNRTAQIASFITAQQTPVHLAALGVAASYGNSTNPDVDGDANYWKSSTGVLSIKNRLGSSRNFMIYVWNAS